MDAQHRPERDSVTLNTAAAGYWEMSEKLVMLHVVISRLVLNVFLKIQRDEL
jgi:hypothetical protein